MGYTRHPAFPCEFSVSWKGFFNSDSSISEAASGLSKPVSRKWSLVARNGLSGTATVFWKGAFRKRFIVSCKRHHGKGFQKRVSPRARATKVRPRMRARVSFLRRTPRAQSWVAGPWRLFFLSTRAFHNRKRARMRGRTFVPQALTRSNLSLRALSLTWTFQRARARSEIVRSRKRARKRIRPLALARPNSFARMLSKKVFRSPARASAQTARAPARASALKPSNPCK